MNVYRQATMSDAKRQANSNVVQMVLKPVVGRGAIAKGPFGPSLFFPRENFALSGKC